MLADDPKVPYVSNTTAEFITSNDQVKKLLGRQVYSSVCWEQSIEKIADGQIHFRDTRKDIMWIYAQDRS